MSQFGADVRPIGRCTRLHDHGLRYGKFGRRGSSAERCPNHVICPTVMKLSGPRQLLLSGIGNAYLPREFLIPSTERSNKDWTTEQSATTPSPMMAPKGCESVSQHPNYFTCTLGEAAEIGTVGDIANLKTVSDFIDHQAEHCPDNHAVGFHVPNGHGEAWNSKLLTFAKLRDSSVAVAIALEARSAEVPDLQMFAVKCVALLCPSSVDFLLVWLALMRLGYEVLLIAPQCQPEAIQHLMKTCNAPLLLYHEFYADLGQKTTSDWRTGLRSFQLPIVDEILTPAPNSMPKVIHRKEALDTAFIFHTSGTSSGLPKPILQSHRAAFAVLPILDGKQSATFTTTPLYHGGIADCCRSWTSGALIWLFPGLDMPITTKNILLCMDVAEKAVVECSAAPVRYFSCVPYVLKMLAEDLEGLGMLAEMEIVGVGGAALSPTIGDSLVEEGVNLISRFGSAECGFLLSSYRDFDTDKEWQYLRLSPTVSGLLFKQYADNTRLSELVVTKEWPHVAKTNRADSSFATSDLFEPHKMIQRAWKYHSRSDSQITLSTGKKFDPAPLEDAISSSCDEIREVLVFGNDKQEPGVLIFLVSSNAIPVVEEAVWKAVGTVNKKGQSHTRIARDMMVFLADWRTLERSSKGTVLRTAMNERYQMDIDGAYGKRSWMAGSIIQQLVDDAGVKVVVRETISHVIDESTSLKDDTDFYTFGMDSLAATRIRQLLQRDGRLFSHASQDNDKERLPWNAVYDCGNIARLSEFIIARRVGMSEPPVDQPQQMHNLARRFSDFSMIKQQESTSKAVIRTILLTGATGSLGAHILSNLLQAHHMHPMTKIICLVRAKDNIEARARVNASLSKIGGVGLAFDSNAAENASYISGDLVRCWSYRLESEYFGFGPLVDLGEVTHIIHAAWPVNFGLGLKSFEPHLVCLHNLLKLALRSKYMVKFSFCSSIASIMNQTHAGQKQRTIIEAVSSNPKDADTKGYSQSKWVAESICAAAAEKRPGMVRVLRIGQLTGDTLTGAWNGTEAWPRMLGTVDVLGCLPRLEQPLNWLPLDVAAKAVIEVTLAESEAQCGVYHLLNNSTETTWKDLLKWIAEARQKEFEVVEPEVWLDRLERYKGDHPAKALLGLWKAALGKGASKLGGGPVFLTEKAEVASAAMREVKPMTEERGKLVWKWLEDEPEKEKLRQTCSRGKITENELFGVRAKFHAQVDKDESMEEIVAD